MIISFDDVMMKRPETAAEENNYRNDDHSNVTEDNLQFIGTKEIANLMGCSVPVARQIMRRKDFPLIMCGKNLKVMKSEFIKWASQRRV